MAAASVSGLPSLLASSRAPAPVTVRSMAASRLAGARALVRAHKLEIGARRGVDEQQASRRFLARRPHQRRAANLRDLDIGEEARERGKLGLREFAIGIERGNAELSLQRALAAGRVEMRAGDRRERRAGLAR